MTWRVDRVLDPERAVLVEGGDALGRRHELRARRGRGRLDEVDDRLLGGAVVPGGQRVGLARGRVPPRGDQRAEHKERDDC